MSDLDTLLASSHSGVPMRRRVPEKALAPATKEDLANALADLRHLLEYTRPPAPAVLLPPEAPEPKPIKITYERSGESKKLSGAKVRCGDRLWQIAFHRWPDGSTKTVDVTPI